MKNVTQPLLSDAGHYALVNGIRMYYELHGSGNPLVLIHGGGSTINTTFGRSLPLFAKSHQVIAVELQAHGHTGDRDAPELFTQDADDVAELLRQLNLPKANIFGFSNGGQTCIEIARQHPERINKLIIASAFYKRSGVPSWFWDNMNNPKFSDMPQVYKDVFAKINPDPAALMNMFSMDAQRMKNFADWNDDAISSIQVPTLILSGDQDLALPEHSVAMYRLLPHGRLAILPGSHGEYMGEMMFPKASDTQVLAFVRLVNGFLNLQ